MEFWQLLVLDIFGMLHLLVRKRLLYAFLNQKWLFHHAQSIDKTVRWSKMVIQIEKMKKKKKNEITLIMEIC